MGRCSRPRASLRKRYTWELDGGLERLEKSARSPYYPKAERVMAEGYASEERTLRKQAHRAVAHGRLRAPNIPQSYHRSQ